MTESEDGKLDRTRSFGVVYGDPNIGFMQDNKPFRHDGRPVIPNPPPNPVTKADSLPGIPKVDDFPTVESVNRPLTHSEKMKQVWANRRAQEQQDASTTR